MNRIQQFVIFMFLLTLNVPAFSVPSYELPADYLRQNPISKFTVEDNRTLTKQFGPGFAGAIFKAWIESQGSNQSFREVALNKVGFYLAHAEALQTLPSKGKNSIIVVSMGLGWDHRNLASLAPYIQDFVNEVQSSGLSTYFLKRDPYGDTRDNIDEIVPQLKSLLKSGKNLILLSLCKGSPEIYGALAKVQGSYLDEQRTQANRPLGYGKVTAVLNLSGMIDGTFLADRILDNEWIRHLAELSSYSYFHTLQDYGKSLMALPSATTQEISAIRNQYLVHLPSDALYIDATGVLTKNGLLERSAPLSPVLQANQRLHLVDGANDGFIEHPGTLLPQEISSQHFTLVLEASHMLNDGYFGPYDLMQASVRKAVYATLIDLALEQHLNF